MEEERAPAAPAPAPSEGAPDVAAAYLVNVAPCTSANTRKNCKMSPNCLHNLGEKGWLTGSRLSELKKKMEGEKDTLRGEGEMVGLVNLGATCYMNSLLQVVFHSLPIRAAVFAWTPPDTARTSDAIVLQQLQRVFAFMQCSKERQYNPSVLVDALQLSHGVQQDAQEFSKLFLHLIERELAKAGDHTITQQYSGELEYRTTCHACRSVSDRPETFYDLELHAKGHTTMEECLASLFHAEELSGTNLYLCGECQAMRPASRQIVLNRLPPVLCFHVLRFVYDLKSGNKKKLGHAITFPELIDLSAYTTDTSAPAVYRLDAALMHRGNSANCGHYFAHIRSHTGPWMQLDDVYCDAIEPEQVGSEATLRGPSASKKKRDAARPNGRYESSSVYMLYYRRCDPGSFDASGPAAAAPPGPAAAAPARKPKGKKSESTVAKPDSAAKVDKDAATSSQHPSQAAAPVAACTLPVLPAALAAEVHAANTAATQAAAERAAELQVRFAAESEASRTRTAVLDKLAAPLFSDAFVWVPLKWLEAWIRSDPDVPVAPPDLTQMLCPHGRFSLAQMPLCKRISSVAWDEIVALSGYPPLSPPGGFASLCADCVAHKRSDEIKDDTVTAIQKEIEREFRMYQRGQIALDDARLFWLSENSYKRFFSLSATTPPAARCFNKDVLCRHGSLAIGGPKRLQVPSAIWTKIEVCVDMMGGSIECIPVAETLACSLCQTERDEQSELTHGDRAEAQQQRLVLRRMAQYNMETYESGLELGPSGLRMLYVLPRAFYESWLMWIQSPVRKRKERPAALSTESLLCEHGKCSFVLTNTTLIPRHPDVLLITDEEWTQLLTFYELRGPAITFNMEYTDPEPCGECIEARRFQYSEADVFVQLISSERPPSPKAVAAEGDEGDRDFSVGRADVDPTEAPTRRSARRVSKGAKKFTVRSTDTLLDLKLQIMNEFGGATPNEQLLFLDHRLLGDHTATLQHLRVPAAARLSLAVSSTDESTREIELGFKGTVLLGDVRPNGHAAAHPAAATGLAHNPTPTNTAVRAAASAEASSEGGHAPSEPILVDDSFGDDVDDAALAGTRVSASPAAEQRDSGACVAQGSPRASGDPLLDDDGDGDNDGSGGFGDCSHGGSHADQAAASLSERDVIQRALASPIAGSSPPPADPAPGDETDDLVVVPQARSRPGKRANGGGAQTSPKRSRAAQPVHVIDS